MATSFEKALGYLEQAVSHGSRFAEAILPRITCAIWGLATPPMTDTLQGGDDAQLFLLNKVSELERRLYAQTSSNNLAERVREWTKWDVERAQTQPCQVQHDDGCAQTILETTEISFLRLLDPTTR